MLPGLLTDTVSPDVRHAVDSALLWGLETVALRTVGRERVPNTNEARLLRILIEAEMPVAWVDPGLFEGDAGNRVAALGDVEALRDLAPFCRRIDCSMVAVGALAASPREESEVAGLFRQLGTLAESLGLTVAVRNGDTAPSAEELAALVRDVDHPAVGALWSVEASREAGDDLGESALALTEAGLMGVEADEGFLEASPEASALEALAHKGFEGPVILTFSGVPEDGLALSTELIRAIRLARRSAR